MQILRSMLTDSILEIEVLCRYYFLINIVCACVRVFACVCVCCLKSVKIIFVDIIELFFLPLQTHSHALTPTRAHMHTHPHSHTLTRAYAHTHIQNHIENILEKASRTENDDEKLRCVVMVFYVCIVCACICGGHMCARVCAAVWNTTLNQNLFPYIHTHTSLTLSIILTLTLSFTFVTHHPESIKSTCGFGRLWSFSIRKDM